MKNICRKLKYKYYMIKYHFHKNKHATIEDALYSLEEQAARLYALRDKDVFIIGEEELNTKSVSDMIAAGEFAVVDDFYERIPPYRFIEKLKFWEWIKKKHLYKIEVNFKNEQKDEGGINACC